MTKRSEKQIPLHIYAYYLPHKIEVVAEFIDMKFQLNTYSNMRGSGTESRSIDTCFDNQYKPILRSLSDLDLSIEIDGTVINPLYELMYMDKQFNKTFIQTYGYHELPVNIFERLLEWHFDVFELEKRDLCIIK